MKQRDDDEKIVKIHHFETQSEARRGRSWSGRKHWRLVEISELNLEPKSLGVQMEVGFLDF